jgi:hypothetical protein
MRPDFRLCEASALSQIGNPDAACLAQIKELPIRSVYGSSHPKKRCGATRTVGGSSRQATSTQEEETTVLELAGS